MATETIERTAIEHGEGWCPCGGARNADGVLVITSLSPYCDYHAADYEAAHYTRIVSAERGERLACFSHGTDCGHDHWLDGVSPHGDIDECPWHCGKGA